MVLKFIQYIALLLMVVASSNLPAEIVRVPANGPNASFSFDTQSTTPIIEYYLQDKMLANPDPAPVLQVYGDGKVRVHYPNYMKKAGDYEMQLNQQELTSLVRSFAINGMMDLDVSKIKSQKKTFDDIKRNKGELFNVSDTVNSRINLRLKDYKPALSSKRIKNFSKTIRLKNIEHDIKRYPNIVDIQKTAYSIRLLDDIMKHNRLTRKQ